MLYSFRLTRLLEVIKYAAPTLTVAAFNRPRVPTQPLRASPSILVVRVDRIGDFILFAPFLRELRRNYPDSSITLVVGKSVASLALPCPYVNEVLLLDAGPADKSLSRSVKRTSEFLKYIKYLVAFARGQLAGRFDLAIQPRWDLDEDCATLLTVLSGAARTVGYSEQASPEKRRRASGFDRLFTDIVTPGPEQHEADRNLDIIRHLGGSVESTAPEIWWSAEDGIHADRFLTESHLSGARRLIAFGIGASSRRRQWPFYADLIRLLACDLEFVPLILAGPGEGQAAKKIADILPSSVVPRTQYLQRLDALARAS